MARLTSTPALIRWTACGLLLSVLPAGCGPGPSSVTGTVTFKDQPLTSGTVLFHGAHDHFEHATIGPDGRYTVANAPRGPVRISVRSHPALPLGMPTKGKLPPTPAEFKSPDAPPRDGKFIVLPARYADPDKSGLTYTVREGAQTHDPPRAGHSRKHSRANPLAERGRENLAKSLMRSTL